MAAIHVRRHIEPFKKKGAVGSSRAITLEAAGLKKENRIMRRLIRLHMIGKRDDKYYITEQYAGTIRYRLIPPFGRGSF